MAAVAPPLNAHVAVLLGLAGLALALFSGTDVRVRVGAWRGFLFGVAGNFCVLRFVPDVVARFTPLPGVAGWLALALLAAGQAVPWAIGGAVYAWLTRRFGTARPLAFGVAVYVASLVPAVFPWTPAGLLAKWPVLLQSAEVVGERGTSFVLAIACALVVAGLRDRRALALAGASFALLLGGGWLRMHGIDAAREAAPRARVALLQLDFDALWATEESKWPLMMQTLTEQTRQAEADGAELTVWPESAYPYALAYGLDASPRGRKAILRDGMRGPLLVGVYLSKTLAIETNSAVLVDANGEIGRSYDKRHLLWFGETVPFGDTFPILRDWFARGNGLDAGTESVVFRTGPIAAAVLNCYEDTLSVAGREAMEGRPNLLVNLTNDAWFVGTAESELHLRFSVLRAIETRRDLVRAVNRGPAAWIDAAGRIRAQRDPTFGHGPAGALLASPALLDLPPTLYVRAGDLPLLLLAVAAVLRKKKKPSTK